ncbi:CGNR zinc finger domain-containing protein [Nocardioides iriomotensis]|jgi:predicted RNA-binding Zn ribbon-like protein|uniref:CGNR zinc finger domain-containing protein n=1 Tax=Nocardioides iriomotensis TaxID=715784 RepID=A0A4Q5J4A7_9ACTN|nr:CGNR zinc finger domain-containing protein [Nocardioides iriomotensis]RYU13500.1 CGNR zinc finger domain-containing protein [Nocardioides iriomotensis]
MDFVRYAERSAALVNADLEDAPALVRFLDQRAWLHDQVVERDATALRRFQRELRPVFEASNDGDEQRVVDQLNTLLAKHPVTPYIAGHGLSGHGGGSWHMHVADRQSSVAELLVAESLMGLSTLVCDLGATRLGVCDASGCDHVFVDTSPNQSRRYCSDRCSSRANVAAYRARQRAAAGEKAGEKAGAAS